MATPTKKSVAKKAPAKKTAAKKTPSPAAKKTATKKTAAKKAAPAKKERSMSKSLKVGDPVMVSVDPRQNGGSSVAAGVVTREANDNDAVNVRVNLDSDEALWLRDVPVAKSAKDAEDASGRVCWSK